MLVCSTYLLIMTMLTCELVVTGKLYLSLSIEKTNNLSNREEKMFSLLMPVENHLI